MQGTIIEGISIHLVCIVRESDKKKSQKYISTGIYTYSQGGVSPWMKVYETPALSQVSDDASV